MSAMMVDPPDTATIAAMLRTAVRNADEARERSQQKRDGILGASDIGFCKALALLTIAQVPESDPSNLWWKGILGTSLGDTVEAALAASFPHWLYPNREGTKYTATLSAGQHRLAIPNTPDIVVPEWNAVIDNKSKDGLQVAMRQPWSQSYDTQTWLQILGLVQAGVLDGKRPLWQILAFWDRSGDAEQVVHVAMKQWLPHQEDEIAFWLDEVIDTRLEAARRDRPVTDYLEPLRDVAAPLCERICAQFGNCRGQLPMREEDVLTFSDPDLLAAIDTYVEGMALAKDAKAMKDDAKHALRGLSGIGSGHVVRWTHVDATFQPGYEKSGYDKIDVRKMRGR